MTADLTKPIESSWLFDVDYTGGTYYWSTKSVSGYARKIIPGALSITINGDPSGIQYLDDLKFSIANPDNTAYDPADFLGQDVTVHLQADDRIHAAGSTRAFKFVVKSCERRYQTLEFVLEDALTAKMRSDFYPPGPAIVARWPAKTNVDDGAMVPIPFGTPYVRLPSAYITDDRYFVLGDASAGTYTIDAVSAPRELSITREWTSADYTFTQSTADGVRVFQPIIADSDSDGTADAAGYFASNGAILPFPTKFSRDDTVSKTNPADVIADLLFSGCSVTIDHTTAANTLTGYGIAINGAFVGQKTRDEHLETLLNHGAAVLTYAANGDREIAILSKTSANTVDASNIQAGTGTGTDDADGGTFSYEEIIADDTYDGGHVAFCEPSAPQDLLHTYAVGLDGSAPDNPSDETISLPYSADAVDAQVLAIVKLQRRIDKLARIRFNGGPELMTLNPDQVLTVSGADYNAATPYPVVIDTITIYEEFDVSITATRFNHTINDFPDLSPSGVTIEDDTLTTAWQPVVAGPDDPEEANVLAGRLTVGSGTTKIILDPDTAMVYVYKSGSKVAEIGDTGVTVYNGGDMVMKKGATPSQLIFEMGSGSNTAIFEANSASTILSVHPDTAGVGQLGIGYDKAGAEKLFDAVLIKAKSTLGTATKYDASYFTAINQASTSSSAALTFTISDGTTYALRFDNTYKALMPYYGAGSIDLGASAYKWRTGYFSDHVDTPAVQASGSAGLSLGDDSGYGPLVNDGGAVTNAYQPAFMAYLSAAQNIPVGTETTIPFDDIFDNGGDFNDSTYTFTAPIGGKYQFNALVKILNFDTACSYVRIALTLSHYSHKVYIYPEEITADGKITKSFSTLVLMAANDTAKVTVTQSGGSAQMSIDGYVGPINTIYTTFSGYLVA